MRAFRPYNRRIFALLLIVSGCGGSSAQRSDGAADAPADVSHVADADGPVDAADAVDAVDMVARDAIDFDATVSCSSVTCQSGEVCVHEKGGTDATPLEDKCYPLPAGCAGVPTCACLAGLNGVSFRCGMSCSQLGDREFMCTGA